MGPFAHLVEMLPTLSRAQVALDKIAELGLRLGSEEVAVDTTLASSKRSFELLELVGVTHRYRREQEPGSFRLGPIDLSFRRGEIVFLVGGNGSGKTTLSKLLLGLYEPEAGVVRMDGRVVDDERRGQLRQLFSVVFADYHVFEALLGLESADVRERARRYIERFGLERCVRIEGQKLVVSGLSQGQRKRLALVAAYLDERPFYVFDEWASDQDPAFRRIFYTELLPELRQRGKAVLVISHDEQFFGVADRCLRMDFGQVFEASLPEPARVAANA
jgi:putative ATP-binding cassette transporter